MKKKLTIIALALVSMPVVYGQQKTPVVQATVFKPANNPKTVTTVPVSSGNKNTGQPNNTPKPTETKQQSSDTKRPIFDLFTKKPKAETNHTAASRPADINNSRPADQSTGITNTQANSNSNNTNNNNSLPVFDFGNNNSHQTGNNDTQDNNTLPAGNYDQPDAGNNNTDVQTNQSAKQKHLVYDSSTNSVRLYGQELVNLNDVLGLIKNKIAGHPTTQPAAIDTVQTVAVENIPEIQQAPASVPVSFNDFAGSTVFKSEDITSEAAGVFAALHISDVTIKTRDKRLTGNGAVATDTYFGRQITYQIADGSIKIMKLFLQKYQSSDSIGKYCIAHVEIAMQGSNQTVASSACFSSTENPGEAKVLYVQDCFGLLIIPSATAQPCANDFNWEGMKSGMANFF